MSRTGGVYCEIFSHQGVLREQHRSGEKQKGSASWEISLPLSLAPLFLEEFNLEKRWFAVVVRAHCDAAPARTAKAEKLPYTKCPLYFPISKYNSSWHTPFFQTSKKTPALTSFIFQTWIYIDIVNSNGATAPAPGSPSSLLRSSF